jgi:predicted LPLAT superfamily acyltransferase
MLLTLTLTRVVRRADGVEGAFSSVGMPSLATALFTRAMGRKASPCFLERRVRRRLSPPRVAFSALPRSFVSLIC